MDRKVLLLVGTKKGVFAFTSEDRMCWERTPVSQPGREINHAVYDARSGRIYACSNDSWFGCQIVWSPDFGKTWESARENPKFAESTGMKLDRIWHIEPARTAEPEVLYAGTAPAALFRSEDAGETWTEVSTLTQHPSRPRWHPGAGGLCLHSIVVDHSNAQRMFVGISAVGVFRTEDGGATWHPANKGTRAEFLPDKYPEFGQCVHKLLMAGGGASSPVLFQQNHCGMYRSGDCGRSWAEITDGLPSDFGFPLALHPRKPETLYVLPLKGAEFRCPPEGKLRVYRSHDGGRSWEGLGSGLPQSDVFCGVYREGMSMDSLDPAGIYFGTNTGKVFASNDEGDSWYLLADNLPPVYSVSAGLCPK